MDGDEQGTIIEKLEQFMVVVENRIYPLNVLGEVRKIGVLLEVAPSFALADLLPTLYGLFRFNNENRIFGNQVNGLQIGLWGKNKNIGQIAQVQYDQTQKTEQNPFFGHFSKKRLFQERRRSLFSLDHRTGN